MPIELSNLLSGYESGKVRHFVPYCVRYDAYTLDVEVLNRKADNSGYTWRKQSVYENGEVLWFKSLNDVLVALADVGLSEAYKLRFANRDGNTFLNW